MRMRFASLIGLIFCLACSTPEERLVEHLENGARFDEQGKFNEAILEYRSALRISPKSAEVNERLAEQLAKTEDPDAFLYYRDAFRLDPRRIEAAIRAARLVMRTDIDAATRLVDDALSESPKSSLAYITKSELALLRNDTRRALAAAQQANRLDPDGASSWYQLGRVRQARILEGRLRKRNTDLDFFFATRAYGRAKEFAPFSVRIRIDLARAYSSRPRYVKKTRAEFKSAMALAEKSGSQQDRLAVAQAAIEFSRGLPDSRFTQWAWRGLVTATPDDISAWRRLAALKDSHGDDGFSILVELIRKRPEDAAAQVEYARYLISKGRDETALDHLRKLLDDGFDAPEFWAEIARVQIHRGKTVNARATYVSMLEHHPDHPVSQQTDARIAIAEGRYEAASTTLRSLATERDSRHIQFLLARSEYELGNLPNAAAAIERALPDWGANRWVRRLKTQIHFAAGEWDGVVESYRGLGQRVTDQNSSEMLMLATSLYETHQAGRGRKLLEKLLDQPSPVPGAAAEYARREGKREPTKAYQHLTAALERNPVDFLVLEAITKFDKTAGREQQAMDRLNRAIETGEARAPLLLLRGRALADTGDYAKAERDVLLALEAEPMLAGAIDLLFSIYQSQGTLLSAQNSFEEAEAAGVLHSGARQLLGRIYRHHGETERAREILEKIETADPKMLGAKADLAALLAESDTDLDRALELAEEVQQHRSLDAGAADAVGYVYLRKGLNEAALQQFRYAIELDENRNRAATSQRQYHLGLALRAMNRDTEASRAFRKALRLDPDFRSADDARSQLEATGSPGRRTPSQS